MATPGTKTGSRRGRTFALATLVAVFLGSACELINNPPSINIAVEDEFPLTGSRQTFTAVTEDIDEDPLRITWSVTGGTLSKNTGSEVTWTAPLDRGSITVRATADDRKSGIDSTSTVLEVINDAPTILDFSADQNFVLLGNTIELTVTAIDANDEAMEYTFFTSPAGVGVFEDAAEPNKAFWTAPTVEETPFARSFALVTKVQDETDFFSTDTISILVYSEYGTVWIADSRQAKVTKYSDRGDFILKSSHAFVKPVALANNTFIDYGAYVADRGAGEVVKLGSLGNMEIVYTNMPNISDMDLHRDSGTLWVLSYGDSSLTVINTFTQTVIKKVYGFSIPQVIKINQSSGDVWIADIGMHAVIQFDANLPTSVLLATLPDTLTALNVTQFVGQFNTPVDIAVRHLTSLDAVVYIADKQDDNGQIEQLVYNNLLGRYEYGVTMTGFAFPTLLASTEKGLVWVANSFGTVSHFVATTNGANPFTIITYDFNNPQTMTPDPITGEVWIGDNGTNEMVKLVAPDAIDVIISGFGFIEDLVINK